MRAYEEDCEFINLMVIKMDDIEFCQGEGNWDVADMDKAIDGILKTRPHLIAASERFKQERKDTLKDKERSENARRYGNPVQENKRDS